MHLKTANIKDYINASQLSKARLIFNDKETDNKFVIFIQINEILDFCVYDIERIIHEIFSKLRENNIFSAIGYGIKINTAKMLAKMSCKTIFSNFN